MSGTASPPARWDNAPVSSRDAPASVCVLGAVCGALPGGVTLSSAGVLSGTPASGTVGSYPVTVTATNGISPAATQAFTLTDRGTDGDHDDQPAERHRLQQDTQVHLHDHAGGDGREPPCEWFLAAASTPLTAGPKLTAKGVITGKATIAGTFSFTVQVVDKETKTKPPTQNTATAILFIAIG